MNRICIIIDANSTDNLLPTSYCFIGCETCYRTGTKMIFVI